MRRLSLCAALMLATASAATATSKGPRGTAEVARAVATFESLGLYWTPPSDPGAAGCAVQYRKAEGAANKTGGAWKKGLDLWYDARNRECRGSLVRLTPGTTYEVQLAVPGTMTTLSAKTWSERFPVARTVTVSGGSQTLNITQGGSPDGYVLYTGAPGTTIDVANKAANNVTISAPYVIVRGLTLKGAQRDAIDLLAGAHDVVIEDNDISGWGRVNYTNSGGWQIGVDEDSGIRCRNVLSVERTVVQRNRIHDPRYGANSWSWGHPAGPQGTSYDTCGGNHVFRWNEIWSSDTHHYFNDGIGGGDNFTDAGFPRADTDIYGNRISNTWDDGIESEGANSNVRIWGNYIDQTATGVATTVVNRGPVYIFRNVYARSRQMSERKPDDDDRNTFAKSGTGDGFGNGRRYVFHNTVLQPPPYPGGKLTSGADSGIYGPQSLTNTVSRNNVFHTWKNWHDAIGGKPGPVPNDLDYDLYNGVVPSGSERHGIKGVPVYASGNGPASAEKGMVQLAPGSPGFDAGVLIPDFNDDYKGAAPDMGAHENGAPAMRFGVAAGKRPEL